MGQSRWFDRSTLVACLVVASLAPVAHGSDASPPPALEEARAEGASADGTVRGKTAV